MNREWYCQNAGQIDGPFTVSELLQMAAGGQLRPGNKVRRGQDGAWFDARQLPGLTFPNNAEAVSAVPPGTLPRESREQHRDVFDDEIALDISEQHFESPRVRAERLLALTGGAKPVELFRTCKIIWKKKPAGFLVNADPSEFYADLIFTDCGLLVAKHARLPKRGESSNSAWLHFGLIGLIAYSVAESSRMSRERSQADTTYFRETEDWDGAKPFQLFRRIDKAEFIPADEISDVQFRKRGELKFRFRDHWCWATPDRQERHEEFRLPVDAEFERWHTEAAALRESRTAGPPASGPAAVAEWSHRPISNAPSWVIASLHDMETRWGERSKELLRWLPKTYHAGLYRRLATVESAAAGAWHRRFGARLRVRGFVLLGIGLLILLIGCGIGLGTAVQIHAKANDVLIHTAAIVAVFAPIALVFLIWGIVAVSKFRNRSVH